MATLPFTPAAEIRKEAAWMTGAALEVCPACKRVFLIPEQKSKQSCPLCYQAELVPQQSFIRQGAPEIILPAQLKVEDIRLALTDFVKGVPLPVQDFSVQNLMDRAQLVWWPSWLVDADLQGTWTGTMGFDYQVRTAKENFDDQAWQSKETLRTQTRYEARQGTLDRHYDNIQVPALRSHERRLEQIGNYEKKTAVYYQAGMLSQNSVQIPEIEPQELLEVAQTRLHNAAEQEIMQANEAQHRQNIRFAGNYLNFNWTQYLLPLISTSYQDEKGSVHAVILNGQTGKIYGRRLASIHRASHRTFGLMAIPLLAFVAALVITLVAPAALPVNLVCGGAIVIFLALLALLPVLRAHHWNNRENKIEDFN